ncbi:MAG TPA: MauE/DoxX family redox-associated membrane protein [Candidatus Acidoferrum sp.]|nr:MauE/DoxX family redox-associated membrane protein [Candidatus Acidoferrum sp.]
MPSIRSRAIFVNAFCVSAGVILIMTGLAKVVSAFGRAGILKQSDPIFGISFEALMLFVGGLEIVIAGICLYLKNRTVAMVAVAWLSSCFLFYRAGLRFIGWHHPCHCLGNLTDFIRISPEMADKLMTAILGYLLLGSYLALFCSCQGKDQSIPLSPAVPSDSKA